MKQNKGYRISENPLESQAELEKISIDVLAELFSRNDSGEFIQLRNYFQPLLGKKRTEL